jgi:hypothetical protein
MADKGIRNVIIKKESLGKVTSSNSRVVRFRVIAEDRNRKSAYSRIFILGPTEAVAVGIGDLNPIGNTIFLNWEVGEVSIQITYDIFVGFDGATPSYIGTTGSKNYSFLKTGTETVRAIVQISSINPVLTDDLEIYDSETRSVTTGLLV